MTDWFASNTPVGDMGCVYCPQVFTTRQRLTNHLMYDHRVPLEINAHSAYPKALMNTEYGRLRLVK